LSTQDIEISFISSNKRTNNKWRINKKLKPPDVAKSERLSLQHRKVCKGYLPVKLFA